MAGYGLRMGSGTSAKAEGERLHHRSPEEMGEEGVIVRALGLPGSPETGVPLGGLLRGRDGSRPDPPL